MPDKVNKEVNNAGDQASELVNAVNQFSFRVYTPGLVYYKIVTTLYYMTNTVRYSYPIQQI